MLLPHQLPRIYQRQATGKAFSSRLQALILLLRLSPSTALLAVVYRLELIIQQRRASLNLHATKTDVCVNYDGFDRTNSCPIAKCVIFRVNRKANPNPSLFRFDVNSSVAFTERLIRAANTLLASKLVKKPSSPKASTTGKRR